MVSLLGGSANELEVRIAGDATDLKEALHGASVALTGFKNQVGVAGAAIAGASIAGLGASASVFADFDEV